VADKIAARRNRAASPRDHVDVCVAGGRSEDISSASHLRKRWPSRMDSLVWKRRPVKVLPIDLSVES
jgi:hypothetical protein